MSEFLATSATCAVPSRERYSWQVALPRADGFQSLVPETMTASEQMFFLGAPLAHVVAYERLLKAARLLRPERSAARLTRMTVRQAALA